MQPIIWVKSFSTVRSVPLVPYRNHHRTSHSLANAINVMNNVPEHPSVLVSADWLAENFHDPRLKVLDASWYLPTSPRHPFNEFLDTHIPGAQFFDIETIADTASSLPNTFPDHAVFSEKVSALGISNDDLIVVYDHDGVQSSPRAWWMFRAFGHREVYVLNGGLSVWMKGGHATESGQRKPERAEYIARAPQSLCDKLFVLNHLGKHQIVDARSRQRFMGTAPEPRPGLPAGHIPGSVCIPSSEMVDQETRLFKTPPQILQTFEAAGLDMSQPIIGTCGSGVGACVVLLALHEAGHQDTLLYDGSWTEWASDPVMPVVQPGQMADPLRD